MKDLKYIRILSEDDHDIPKLTKMHKLPDISRFLSIGDNYFHYVTNTENVYFYKAYEEDTPVGSVHLEKNGGLLYMSILIFPEFQRKGFGTKIIEDVKNDVFGLGYEKIEISIDENNYASIKLFENAGFSFVSKEDELINYIDKIA